MAIEVRCECGRRLRARDELAGKRAKCPSCGVAVRVPAIQVPMPAPAPAPEMFPEHAPDVPMRKPAPAPGMRMNEPALAPGVRIKKPAPPPREPVPAGMEAPDPYAMAGEGDADPFDQQYETFPGFPPLPSESAAPAPAPLTLSAPRKRPAAAPKRMQPALKPLRGIEDESPSWISLTAPAAGLRRFAYLLLLLAIFPLVIHTLSPHETLVQRLAHTAQTHPDLSGESGEEVETRADLRDLLRHIPGHKLDGALLPYKSSAHYLFALISAACFMGLGLWIMPCRTTRPLSVFLVGLFTGTLGIILLLIVQFLAMVFGGHIIIPRSIVGVVILVLQLIGLSYRAALDPNNSFLLSFIGFTFGVGLCEEFCKAMPVLWNFKTRASLDWRGAFQWGLLSGVGFGVSEGITYAADYYNGVESGSIYLVRFISCVALHATWSASAGVSIYRRQDRIQMAENAFGFFGYAILLIFVPMLLHGLYDTLLKKEMDVGALFVAILSVVYLAYEVESVRRMEDRGVLPQVA